MMGLSSSSSDDGPRLTTAHGARVIVRAIEPGDAPALHAAFHALSEESRYRRFMGHVTELSPDMLRYLCDVDGHDHVAYVAFSEEANLEPGKLVGVARFIRARDENDTAELAITVADELHGLGLARSCSTSSRRRRSREGSVASRRTRCATTTRFAACSCTTARRPRATPTPSSSGYGALRE